MMRMALVVAVTVVTLPGAAFAQSFGIGVRGGTFGFGGEVSIRLMDNLGVRGGVGVLPFEYSGDFGDVRYSVKPTSPLMNAGVDFFPGFGSLRVGAGLLFVTNTTDLTGEYTGTVDIGGRTYRGDEVGTLTGALDHGSMAPYLNLGFGGRGRGVGLFLDLGAAFMPDPTLTLEASGPAANNPQFRQDLEEERRNAEEDARKYLRIFPVISLGLRFGLN
jgi:hypothetical protein